MVVDVAEGQDGFPVGWLEFGVGDTPACLQGKQGVTRQLALLHQGQRLATKIDSGAIVFVWTVTRTDSNAALQSNLAVNTVLT